MNTLKRFSLFIATILTSTLACRLPQASTPTSQPATSPALAPGLQIGVVSTTLGGLAASDEAAPDQPGGGMQITVEDVQPGQTVTVAWKRTIEREVNTEEPTPIAGVGTPTPTAVTRTVTQEGVISGQGLDDAHVALIPIYWSQIETETTDTSLMWLSNEAFSQLKETRQTRWSADVLTRISNLPDWALDQIDDTAADHEVFLRAEPEFVEFELTIEDRPTTVRALQAFDDFGNQYVILDNAENPLILKFTFNTVSTGAIGIDVGVWTLIKTIFSGYQVVEMQ